jgi:signal transduction histidine kinase
MRSSFTSTLFKIISAKPPKTERLLSLFLILVISIMSVLMLSVMSAGLESDLNSRYKESNAQKAISLTDQVARFLNARVLQLEAQANSPILRQAAMQPNQSIGLVRDFLDSQTILGNNYPQTIYDFKGALIFDTASEQFPEHQFKSVDDQLSRRLSRLLNGSQSLFIEITPDSAFWEITLPIMYGQSIEGVLLTYIPIDEMVSILKLDNTLDVAIRATTSNGKTLSWGANNEQNWQAVQALQNTIKMAYAIDMSSVEDSFKDARNRLAISMLVIAALSIGLAIFVGRWFFVRPMEELQQFASALSEGSNQSLTNRKSMTIEIQQLSDQIREMAKKISHREKSLIRANETLKNNQDTLVHAEKMAGLGQVTAGVAHEINNPIAFIMNNLTVLTEYHALLIQLLSELLALRDKLPENAKYALGTELTAIEETLSREDLDFVLNDLACLTDESLEGSRRVRDITLALKGYSYAGESSSKIDITEGIESTLKMVWNELKYNCSIQKNFAVLPKVECIGSQINQVFMNLFVNAAHAMEDKSGALTITTSCNDESVIVEVKDNGCGIRENNLKHIFEPFFTTKAVGEGTGLGMSICYDIIKKHHGSISVDSELGVGSAFTITLPIKAHPEIDLQIAN